MSDRADAVAKGGAAVACEPALAAERVGKTFGRHRALVDVSLTCGAGEVTAILGPNGAGKSTLLALLATLADPTTGKVRWGSAPLHRGAAARARIGWVGHEPGLYGDLSALENLRVFGGLHGLPAHGWQARAEALLHRVGLGEAPRTAPARTFSRGMQQRLALARALLHVPDILLFDEPSAALDPAGAAWLATQLETERAAGRVVVLVTHDLDLAAAAATHLVVLRRGRLARDQRFSVPPSPEAVRALYAEASRG